jgi:hypothetical protein
MRIFLFFCFILFLISCHGEGKSPGNSHAINLSADSTVKFRSLEFIVDGKPCTALINEGYINFKQKKEFPLSLFITINTAEKDSVGHPTAKETGIFNALENEILSKLVFKTCYIGKTTMNGYRDMMFYIVSGDQKRINDILKSIKKKQSRIRSYTFENDPEWEAVSEFYAALQ